MLFSHGHQKTLHGNRHEVDIMDSRREQKNEASELQGKQEDKRSRQKCEVCLDFFGEETLENGKSQPKTAECDHLTEELEQWFIEIYCTKTMFTTYCDLALQSHLRSNPNFFWCLAPNCGSGQIREGDDPEMICGSCKASTCVHHQTAWHNGLTCEQFDLTSAKDEKSQKKIEKITVACPKCHARIERRGGCLSVMCTSKNAANGAKCGFEFCHSCLVPWGFFTGLFPTKHNPGCILLRKSK
ncbi:hypothetical protein BGAL_0084g00280 [Botrytis galanthina]|uniref:RBR-type E3 ubiquitin transferase n=1 Tax=Botrytis galanthina TaxID=278940 RepID=A0A4S8R371_9HELO|nr:hypothetical protein BGAL_0084g00280 [Botrytis galanthina]